MADPPTLVRVNTTQATQRATVGGRAFAWKRVRSRLTPEAAGGGTTSHPSRGSACSWRSTS